MKPTYEELAAQVELLQESDVRLRDLCEDLIDHLRYNKRDSTDNLEEFWGKLESIKIVSTPSQCLAQVKADAVESLLPKCIHSVDHGVKIMTHDMIRYNAERIRQGEGG